jgi:hypothetical protein
MAVPSTGALTMLGVAQERKYGTYGTGTISSPITMYDLLNGGGANAFPALNTCPQPNVPSYSMDGWYGYSQTATCGGCVMTELQYDANDPFIACNEARPIFIYTDSSVPQFPWQDGGAVYTDDTCTSIAPSGWYSSRPEVAYWDGKAGKWTMTELCG